MINRPPSLIELNLENDLIDYTETLENRKIQYNLNINKNNASPYHNFKINSNYTQFSNSSSFSPYNNIDGNNIKHDMININNTFTPDRNPKMNIYKEDVSMK